jgi:predicted secreted protein
MRKRIITVLLMYMTTAVLLVPALAAESETAVYLDGTALAAPALVDGTSVSLPFRAVCEALGYTVTWANDGGSFTVTAEKNGDSVTLDMTRQRVKDNGHEFGAAVVSGAGVRLVSGRTYVDSGLFSSVFPVDASYDKTAARIALARRFENDVTIANEKIDAQKDFLKTTIQYPQLNGLKDPAAQAAVNNILKQAATAAQAAGEKNAADMVQAIKEGYTGAVGQCETTFDYMLGCNRNGLLSVVLSDYQYAGGAHGSTVQRSWTFDLNTGKALKLGDLMKTGSAYADTIDAAIRREIDARVAAGGLVEFDFSKFKDIGKDPAFYLSNDSAVFYFQQYEYFPYAAGIQEFGVKFADLAPMIADTYRFLYDAPVQLKQDVRNTLPVGGIGQVTLSGNPTTGYSWHYKLSDGSILTLASSDYAAQSRPGLAGAGGTYVWNFKAVKAGNTSITFKYYRDWEGESSATAENTAVYQVTVS